MLSKETGAAAALSSQHVVDTKQAALYLGLSKNTLEAWRSRGGGPAYIKYPRAVRYRITDLDEFMANGVRSNTSQSGVSA